MRRENYKSDIKLEVTLKLGGVPIGVPDHDFALHFFTEGDHRIYCCHHRGDEWLNCKAEGDKLICSLDNHHLGCGMLMCEYYDYAPDVDFADGNQLKVVPNMLDIELIEDAGDDATAISAEVAIDIVGALADVRAAVARLNELLASLMCSEDGFFYVDAAGNIAFKYTPADGFDAAKVSDHFRDLVLMRLVTSEDGFYYTDREGNIAFKYTPGEGFDAIKLSNHFKVLVLSLFGIDLDGFYYTDKEGNVAMRYTPENGLDAAKASNHFKELILSRLATTEDGLYYTDNEGNVAMQYTSAGFDVAKLSNHFKNLLPEGGGGGGEPVSRELKLLCVGNSYTCDEVSYLPYVLTQMSPDIDLKICLAYSGSASLSQWVVQFDHAEKVVPNGFSWYGTGHVEWTSDSGVWTTHAVDDKSLSDILDEEAWDVVTFQQVSDYAASYSTIQSSLSQLVQMTKAKVPGAKIGWLFTHVWNDYYSAVKKNATDSNTRWSAVKDVVKTIMDSHVVDFMIPNGTAIQNLRQTEANSLGSSSSDNISAAYPNKGLTIDGSHLQEGLGPLCASMCMACWLTKAIPDVFLQYESSWNVPGAQGTAVGMTAEYETLACKCAIDAILSPYTLMTEGGGGEQVQSDWTETDSSGPAYIKNKPTLATVATSGSYNDLTNKPTIPAAVTVVDNLTSTSTTDALAANQGRALKKMLDEYCPIIEDTRSSRVSTITGVAPFASLEDKQMILLHTAMGSWSYANIKLTLSNGIDTDTIPFYCQRAGNISRVGSGTFSTEQYILCIYDDTNTRWLAYSIDSNTEYSATTQAEITAGTSTSSRVVTPKLLVDNFEKRRTYVDNSADASVQLAVTTYNDLGTLSAWKTITLPASYDRADEFVFRFTCNDASLTPTLPTGVVMADNFEWSEMAVGVVFQVSIFDGEAAYLVLTPNS